jgi:hypothetical protein
MRLPWPPRIVRQIGSVYVLVMTVAGGYAFSSADPESLEVELVAFVLLLPALVVALPVMYVVGALAWQLRADLPGEPMWPVTLTFALLFAASATANVLIVWGAASLCRRQSLRRGSTTR